MKLDINGKSQKLELNTFSFVKQLDEKYKVNEGGMSMGMGIAMAHNLLDRSGDLNALVNIIYAATDGPTKSQIEKALEDHAIENDGLEELIDQLSEEMGKAPLIKASLKKLQKVVDESNPTANSGNASI